MKHLMKTCAIFMLGAGYWYAIRLNPSINVMLGAAVVFLLGLYILLVSDA